MRWGEATTLKFVKLYLKQECLWNPTHPSYKLRHKREKAYAQISSEFKETTGKYLSLLEVKIKIKNLRTTYCQQVQKILRKSSPDALYEPSLIWFHEMDQCLKNVPSNRHSVPSYVGAPSYVHDTSEIDSSSQSVWTDQDLLNSTFENVNADPLIAQTLSDDEYDPQDQEDSLQKLKMEQLNNSLKMKKNKKKKFKRRPMHTYVIDSHAETMSKEDEFDIYGKYIASQLRKMDLHKALKIQLEIQSLVSGARLTDDS